MNQSASIPSARLVPPVPGQGSQGGNERPTGT